MEPYLSNFKISESIPSLFNSLKSNDVFDLRRHETFFYSGVFEKSKIEGLKEILELSFSEAKN